MVDPWDEPDDDYSVPAWPDPLAIRLCRYRWAHGESASVLAEDFGVSPQEIRRVMRGKAPQEEA